MGDPKIFPKPWIDFVSCMEDRRRPLEDRRRPLADERRQLAAKASV
jgi:hypothetical protein